MKPVIIIAIAVVLLIPIPVFADEQLSKYGIDVFVNKGIYQVGETIEIYINLDQERFETNQKTQIQIWEASHTKHDVLVDPLETFTFKYTLDNSVS